MEVVGLWSILVGLELKQHWACTHSCSLTNRQHNLEKGIGESFCFDQLTGTYQVVFLCPKTEIHHLSQKPMGSNEGWNILPSANRGHTFKNDKKPFLAFSPDPQQHRSTFCTCIACRSRREVVLTSKGFCRPPPIISHQNFGGRDIHSLKTESCGLCGGGGLLSCGLQLGAVADTMTQTATVCTALS